MEEYYKRVRLAELLRNSFFHSYFGDYNELDCEISNAITIIIRISDTVDQLVRLLAMLNLHSSNLSKYEAIHKKFTVEEIWDYLDRNTSSVDKIDNYFKKWNMLTSSNEIIYARLHEKKSDMLDKFESLLLKIHQCSFCLDSPIYAILANANGDLCYYFIDENYRIRGHSYDMSYYFNSGKKLRVQLLNGKKYHISRCNFREKYLELIGFVSKRELEIMKKSTIEDAKDIASRHCYLLPFNTEWKKLDRISNINEIEFNTFKKYVNEEKYIKSVLDYITRVPSNKSARK